MLGPLASALIGRGRLIFRAVPLYPRPPASLCLSLSLSSSLSAYLTRTKSFVQFHRGNCYTWRPPRSPSPEKANTKTTDAERIRVLFQWNVVTAQPQSIGANETISTELRPPRFTDFYHVPLVF